MPGMLQAVPSIVFKMSLYHADVSRMMGVVGVLRELKLAARNGRQQSKSVTILSQLLLRLV